MTDERGYAWLRELAADPDRLRLPPALLPCMVWPGRTTLLSGAEKSGKSEAASQGVAVATRGGSFLGDRCAAVTCFWLCLDEPDADLTRRLVSLEADLDRVAIRTTRPDDVGHLAAMVRETGANLVVVDTLMSFMSGLVTRGGDAAEWTPHLKGLTGVSRATGAGMLWLHHANKSTGNYRDSSAIGAEADVLLELQPHQHGDTVRKVRVKARLPLRDYELDFVGGRYQLAGADVLAPTSLGDVPANAQVLLQLLADAEPEGFTSTAWQKAANLSKTTYNRARRSLLRDGLALDPQATKSNRYRITAKGERAIEVPGATGANEVPRHHGTTGLDGATGAKPYVIGLAPAPDPALPNGAHAPHSDRDGLTDEEAERLAIELEGVA